MAKDKSDQDGRPSAGGIAVTYRPLDPIEPNVITWNKIEFPANTPVMLDPAEHFIIADIPKQVTLPDGTAATKTQPTRVSMIELAKGNPAFEVAGFPRAKRIKPKGRVPQPGAEWEGTDREELIQQMTQITDFDPHYTGAIIVSG